MAEALSPYKAPTSELALSRSRSLSLCQEVSLEGGLASMAYMPSDSFALQNSLELQK